MEAAAQEKQAPFGQEASPAPEARPESTMGNANVTGQSVTAQSTAVAVPEGAAETRLARRVRRRDWNVAARLPTPVTVSVPIAPFRVRDVLALEPGAVIASTWRGDNDVPFHAGTVQLGWAVFEATDEDLGARITRVL